MPLVLSDLPRADVVKGHPTLVVGHVELRPTGYEVLVNGRRAALTIREFETLYVLVERSDRVVRREELYDLIWGGPMSYRDRSVDVFVRKVRHKLAAASPDWTYIHTHFAVGYRFTIEPAPATVQSV